MAFLTRHRVAAVSRACAGCLLAASAIVTLAADRPLHARQPPVPSVLGETASVTPLVPGLAARRFASGARRLGLEPPVLTQVAAAEASIEYDVKAVFLLNFAKFVQWPPQVFREATAPFVLCVLRQNPFGDALDQAVQGEQIGGRAIAVRHLKTPDLAVGCHMLFVPRSVLAEDGVAAVPVETGLLTVGESETFLKLGGVISFFNESGRVRFAVNSEAAERTGLRLSSRLLRVARVVPLGRPRQL
jgi:hypothetical protein